MSPLAYIPEECNADFPASLLHGFILVILRFHPLCDLQVKLVLLQMRKSNITLPASLFWCEDFKAA